jgi:hypothetical protein
MTAAELFIATITNKEFVARAIISAGMGIIVLAVASQIENAGWRRRIQYVGSFMIAGIIGMIACAIWRRKHEVPA